MRKLADENWPDFLSASLTVLADSVESHGVRYLVSLLLRGSALHGALCNPALFSISQAAAVARLILVVEPRFGVDFARRLTSIEAINDQEAERILTIIEEVSDSMGVRPSFAPLLHHPNRRIRSKAALLIGRLNRNPGLAEEQLSDEDARVRANAVEALWGSDDLGCAAFFYDAARDTHQRVAGNAIVGLYMLHQVSSIRLLHELADRPSLAWQITAAWAMGITGSPRFQPALTRLMSVGDPQLRQHAIRSLSRIRQTCRTSQLAGSFAIALWPDTRWSDRGDRECLTKLIAKVGTDKESHVPNLLPTEFLLLEGEQSILDFSIVEHSAPPAMAVGFLIPGIPHAADPVLMEYLDQKRPADQWCVHRYSTEASLDPRPSPMGPASPQSGVLGLKGPELEIAPARVQFTIRFTSDTVALGKAIADDAPGSTPHEGLAGAFNAMVEAVVAVPSSRHLICMTSASSVPASAGDVFDDLKAAATRARRGKVAIHAIVPANGAGARFFEALCRDTGGGFYPISHTDEIPAILQRIQVSLFDRYEISFSRTNPEAQDLTVRICSPRGYGEAEITASPSLCAARDS